MFTFNSIFTLFNFNSLSQVTSPDDLKKFKQMYNPNWGQLLLYRINLIWSGLSQIPWGIVLIAFILSYLMGHLTSWVLFKTLRYFKHWRGKFINPENSQALIKAGRALITVVFFRLVILEMAEDGIDKPLNDFLDSIRLICLTYFGISLWEVVMDSFVRGEVQFSRQLQTLIIPFVRKVVRVLIIIIGFATVASLNGVNVNGFFALFAFGTVAFGLAAKETLENFFGAFSIVLDMPFGIGDWIKIGAYEGAVDQINIRSTRLRTAADSLITIPNGNFVKAYVENLGVRRHIHCVIQFSVSAETDPNLLNKYCSTTQKTIGEMKGVNADATYVYPINFDLRGVVIKTEVCFDGPTYRQELEHQQAFVTAIMKTAQEMNIKMVFITEHESYQS